MLHMSHSGRPIDVVVICAVTAMSLFRFEDSQAARNNLRMSPLCEAIVSNDVERATRLVEKGANVNADNSCALSMAAARDQLQLVELLLDHGASLDRIVTGDKAEFIGYSSPLVAAVGSRDVRMVRLLLERGADPRNEFEAFQIVLNFNAIEMAELLLRHGANANMAVPGGSAVYAYVDIGPEHVQQVEVPRRDLAADRIDDTVKRLDCRISGLAESTSLLYVAAGGWGGPQGVGGPESGSLDQIVRLLLDHGADPNSRTLIGSTPLMHAASQHHHQIMTILMDAGADVKATDRCGRTAADYAVLYPHYSSRANLAQETKRLLQERQRE